MGSVKNSVWMLRFMLSPLHIACKRGNVQMVKKLLKSGIFKGSDVDKCENTILHYICSRQQVDSEMVKIFCQDIETSEMIEKKNTDGCNPLHFVCENNGIQVLHCLSKHLNVEKINAALYSTNKDGSTSLHIALGSQGISVVRYLLNDPKLAHGVSEALCIQNLYSYSPLHVACEALKFKYIELVLSSPYLSKESINEAVGLQDRNGNNVFHIILNMASSDPTKTRFIFESFMQYACVKKQEKVIVSAVCKKNNNFNTPLQCSIHQNNCDELTPSILSWLLSSNLSRESIESICSVVTSEGDTLVHLATNMKMLKTVKVLVEHKLCDPEKTNNIDQTSFHRACALNNFSDIALFLCEHGCNAHKLDKRGHTPIWLALQFNYSLFQTLISKGYCQLEETAQSVKGKIGYCYVMHSSEDLTIQLPVLHTMLHNGWNLEYLMESLMIEQKISPNISDSFGNSVLHLISFTNKTFPHDLLKHHDCCVNEQNKEGNTPLHIACATGNKSVVKLLIESERCSESLSIQNVDGHTPLYYASDRDSINYLILNGADPKDVADSVRVKHIVETLENLKDKHPLNPTVTALVLGNSLAGKTTLINSLTRAYKWGQLNQPSIGQVKHSSPIGETERTAGVEISEYKVDMEDTPRILFYDFAGQPEFQSTHSVLLQSLLSLSQSSEHSSFLFLIVLDITTYDNLKQLMYWAKFIENCQSTRVMGKPEVIAIGSHVDKLPTVKDVHEKIKDSLNKTMGRTAESIEFVENPILLDCREPSIFELQKVEALLSRSTKNIQKRADLDDRSHLIFAYLYEHFSDKPVKLSELQTSLRKRKMKDVPVNGFPFTKSTLIELLKGMHNRQHILLIGYGLELSDFWILTARAQSLMFKNVHGLLFARDDFEMHIEVKSNVGVLSSTVLKKSFPEVGYELLQQFLVYSEFCKKIDDEEVLKLIESGESDSYEHEEAMDHSSNHDQNLGGHDQPKPDQLSIGRDDQDTTVDYFFFSWIGEGNKKTNMCLEAK